MLYKPRSDYFEGYIAEINLSNIKVLWCFLSRKHAPAASGKGKGQKKLSIKKYAAKP